MAKCKDCAWYPWMLGADVSMLPVAKCHPDLPARRWAVESLSLEHNCPKYKAVYKAVIKDDTDTGIENKAAETAG